MTNLPDEFLWRGATKPSLEWLGQVATRNDLD